MSDEETLDYGREAAAVIGNRAYQQAFADIERELVNKMADESLTAARLRELQQMLSMGRRYRKQLERAMADGKFVAESLKQTKRWREGL